MPLAQVVEMRHCRSGRSGDAQAPILSAPCGDWEKRGYCCRVCSLPDSMANDFGIDSRPGRGLAHCSTRRWTYRRKTARVARAGKRNMPI